MRCAVMTQGLFEVRDAHEQNETRLTKDISQLKDDLKAQSLQVEEMTKKLEKMNK